MIHSGSRAIGQLVKSHHLARATLRSAAMSALDAETPQGAAYLQDQDWARRFADANRRAMGLKVTEIVQQLFKADCIEPITISCDHNHVRREDHFGESLLVHRKGAMPADAQSPGIVPGSMGTRSFHVEGRGVAAALRSSAHGAGRLLSRHSARERYGRSELTRQMQGIWFDPRLTETLREESPRAYKDIHAVMRAQGDLVKITRTLQPLLVYKGR